MASNGAEALQRVEELKPEKDQLRSDSTAKVVTAPPSGIQWWPATAFPDVRKICSATAEVSGTVDPSGFSDWAALANGDVTVVRTPLGVAETSSVLLTQNELAVTTAAVLARHLVVLIDPGDIVVNIHVGRDIRSAKGSRLGDCL